MGKNYIYKKVRASILYSTIAGSIVACGGGGGGSGENGPEPQIEIPMQEMREGAEITFENTSEIIDLSIQPFFVVEVLEAFWFTELLANQTVDGPAGGTATVSNDNGFLQIEYNDFALSDELVVDGIQRQSFLDDGFSVTLNNEFTPIEGQLEFENFRVITNDADLLFDGTISTTDSRGTEITLNIEATDNDSNETILFESALIDYSLSNSIFNVVDLQGTITSSLSGQILLSTERPLTNPSIDQVTTDFTAEGNGVLSIEGENSALKLVTQNTNFVSLVFDSDGDEQFESSVRQRWANINNGNELEDLSFTGSSVPIANAGTSTRLELSQAPHFITSLYSTDQDSNLLSHEWKLEVSPLDSNLSQESFNTPYFLFEPDQAGDYIYSLRVSDGNNESLVGVKFEVTDSDRIGFNPLSDGLRAGLEVTESFDGTRYSYEINAERALNPTASVASVFDPSWSLSIPNFSTATIPPSPGGEVNSFQSDPSQEGNHRVTVVDLLDRSRPRTSISFSTGGIAQDFMADIDLDRSFTSIVNIDLNDDGFDDFIGLANADFERGSEETRIYLSLGNGSYELHQILASGSEMLTVMDVNNDDRLDLITLQQIDVPFFQTDYQIRYSLQNQNGMFEEFSTLSIADNLPALFSPVVSSGMGNFDNDIEEEYWVVLEGRRSGTSFLRDDQPILLIWEPDSFSSQPQVVELNSYDILDNFSPVSDVIVDDVNEDGLDDVIFTLSEGRELPATVHIWENNTDGFLLSNTIDSSISEFRDLLFYDQNNDEINDLVFIAMSGIEVVRGSTIGEFSMDTSISNEFVFENLGVSDAVDFDSDGDLDIVSIGSRGTFYLLQNNMDSYRIFDLARGNSLPFNFGRFSIFDYNKDGDMDVITPEGFGVRVYLNGLRSFSTLVE